MGGYSIYKVQADMKPVEVACCNKKLLAIIKISLVVMSLRSSIKLVLATLDKAIKQTPIDKQPFLAHKISKINEKYSQLSSEHNDPSYLKELEFNLNFVRLSFPYLDYSPPKPQQEAPPQQQPQAQTEQPHAERVQEEFFQLQDKQKMQKFVQQTAKVLEGVRQQVEFSNWGTGNVDPEDLKRHRQLLKRQHFAGQFWKDKPKPTSPTAAYLMDVMQNAQEMKNEKIEVEQQEAPAFAADPDLNWEKVKR